MSVRNSHGLGFALAAILITAVGCSSDTTPTTPSAADSAAAFAVANTFDGIADSIVAAHGDTATAARYRGVATMLRRVPVFDTITILVDSQPVTFDAIALGMDLSAYEIGCPATGPDSNSDTGSGCLHERTMTARTLIAWQRGHPAQFVALSAQADSSSIGSLPRVYPLGGDSAAVSSPSADTSVVFRIPAHLTYFTGNGAGVWWGTSGYQVSSVVKSGEPCQTPDAGTVPDITPLAGTPQTVPSATAGATTGATGSSVHRVSCEFATFTFQFASTVSVPPAQWWPRNTAHGTHTLSLVPAKVHGAYITLSN